VRVGRIANTVQLAKASWQVLEADKELLLLPIMSFIATSIVAATFLVPIFVAGGVATQGLNAVGFIIFAVMYVSLAFVTIFFNAALVMAADERLRGGDPTLRSALRGAWRHVGRILPWAIVSATVSVILRVIEERSSMLGRIVASIFGVAWSMATFLVIPVLVMEDVGVVDAVRRSGSLFKQTWGENVAAQVGFGLLGFLAALPAVVLVALSVGAGAGLVGVAIVVGVMWVVTVAVVLASLNGIFQAALYRYAVDGRIPGEYFSHEALSTAFAPRRRPGFTESGI